MTNFLLFWHIRCSCGANQFIKVPPTLQHCLLVSPTPHGVPGPAATWEGADRAGLGSPQLDSGANRQPWKEAPGPIPLPHGSSTPSCD